MSRTYRASTLHRKEMDRDGYTKYDGCFNPYRQGHWTDGGEYKKRRTNTVGYINHRRAFTVTLDWCDMYLDRCYYHQARRRMDKAYIRDQLNFIEESHEQ